MWILTAPLDVNAQLRISHLVALVTSDVLARYHRSRGVEVRSACGCTTGDLAGQHEVDRELMREGLDRAAVGTDAFVERVQAREAASRARLTAVAERIGIDVDLDAGALDGDAAALAARTAFVRLFESGLLSHREEVVDTCPTCATVVDGADREPADVEGEAVVLRLGTSLEVVTETPELLPATVAVVVPESAGFEATHVELPIDGRDVPVVRDADASEPHLLAPVDGESHQLARRLGLSPIELFDVDGIAHHDGPLDGLPRFAARAAARDLLAADGVIVRTRPISTLAWRCRYCRTVLVPRLARQWVVDAAAEATAPWCISRQVLAGQAIPASSCRDCGRVSVSVETPSSCPRCMSRDMAAESGVLDAAFVGAVWPVAAQGWPNRAPSGPATLVVSRDAAGAAVRMATLGQRLAGSLGSEVVVVDADDGAVDADEFDALITSETARAVRTALLRGGLDMELARRDLAPLDAPTPLATDIDIDAAEKSFHAAMLDGRVAEAWDELTAATRDGVAAAQMARIRGLAGPFLGGT